MNILITGVALLVFTSFELLKNKILDKIDNIDSIMKI